LHPNNLCTCIKIYTCWHHSQMYLEDLGTMKGHHTQLHSWYLPYKGVPLSDFIWKTRKCVPVTLMSRSAYFSQNHKFANIFPFFFMLELSDDQALCTRVRFPPKAFIQKLSDWCEKKNHNKVIVNVTCSQGTFSNLIKILRSYSLDK
jgi:hypothetical protein